LSNNINSLTVIVWVIDVLLLSFLGWKSLIMHWLVLHLLESWGVLSVWCNLRNLSSCYSNCHFIFIRWLGFFTNDVQHWVF
jgi:hypothetical protein